MILNWLTSRTISVHILVYQLITFDKGLVGSCLESKCFKFSKLVNKLMFRFFIVKLFCTVQTDKHQLIGPIIFANYPGTHLNVNTKYYLNCSKYLDAVGVTNAYRRIKSI